MRVTTAINELRRELNQPLNTHGYDGRFQAIENTVDGITATIAQLQNIVSV